MGFSWFRPINWIHSRRHMLALIYDYTARRRAKLVKQLEQDRPAAFSTDPPLRLQRDLPAEFNFLVLGDTGEGDNSQSVLVDKLLQEGRDTEFMIIGSDVIYPSGRFKDYYTRFYTMYRNYQKDIYAIPGNHDWYDGLDGFMINFCDFGTLKEERDRDILQRCRAIRNNHVYQPNVYFTIDAPTVRVVCIDTGVKGYLDKDQRAWLEQVSNTDKRKVLIAGNPIFVNGDYEKKLEPIHSILQKYGYLLYIAGDIHNYQRYEVEYPGQRGPFTIYHVVNGGGGAFLHSTANIPDPTQLSRIGEYRIKHVTLYPDKKYSQEIFKGCLRSIVELTELSPLGPWVSGIIDAFVDRDRPPFAQSFLKVWVGTSHLKIQMFRVEDFSPEWVDAPPYEEFIIP
jgi:hypothetical protein